MAGNRCSHSVGANYRAFAREARGSNLPQVFGAFSSFLHVFSSFFSRRVSLEAKISFFFRLLLLSVFSSFFFLLRLFRGGRKGVKVTELTLMGGCGGVWLGWHAGGPVRGEGVLL